jgi:outer membrane protein OmpU
MNKLNKIGVSALCGSLAAISAAHAGDLTVTGGADMTWMSKDNKQVTGNPIGIGSNLTFSGSGELDNGWTVDLSVANTNANAYSNTNVTIGVPGLGDVRVDQGTSGTGIQRMDDMTPSAWEEADGAGLSAGINKVMGTSAGTTVELTLSEDIVPAGATVRFAYSKDADGSNSSDKGTAGTTGVLKAGWDLTAELGSDLHGIDGLTVYGGMSQVEKHVNATKHSGDVDETVIGIKYAAGNFTVGYQITDEDTGETGTTGYKNTAYSISFNVNDDLSVSYGHVESDEEGASKDDPEADSIQAAYTMGGATFRIAEVDVENQAYSSSGDADLEATVISLGLAF